MKFVLPGLFLLTLGMSSVSAQFRPLPETNDKFQNVHRILTKVAATFGQARPVPRLVMYSGKTSNRVAHVSETELSFDERLYDLCRKMGKDSSTSIAYILSHELTHYFLKHEEWAGFAQMMSSQQKKFKSENQAQSLELQADRQGLFHAFCAGYNAFDVLPKLYGTLYKEYGLPDQLKGYLPRQDRIDLATQEARLSKRYAQAYEVGKFLLLMKEYASAESCFAYVIGEIPVKDVYLNWGVSLLSQALVRVTLPEMPFRLPVEMEGTNRLFDLQRGDEDVVIRNRFLKQAVEAFTEVLRQDPANASAYLNLAITQLLLGKPGTALETLDELKQNSRWSDQATQVRAIAALKNGNYTQAAELFHTLADRPQTAYNRAVFGKFGREFADRKSLSSEEIKRIQETIPTQPIKPSAGLVDTPEPIPSRASFACDTIGLPTPRKMQAYVYHNPTQRKTYYWLESTGRLLYSFVHTQGSIASPSQVMASYGNPAERLPYEVTGEYWLYPNAQLIFQVQRDIVENTIQYKAVSR